MKEKLYPVELKKVIYPPTNGTALILSTEIKTFVMFVGLYEGAAIIRELNGDRPPRPLTHELIVNILAGFDIHLKQVIIYDIIDSAFIANLILEQVIEDEEDGTVKRQEVRIDARPSDCIILALKFNKEIYVTQKVLDQVTDIKTEFLEKSKDPIHFDWKDIDFDFEDEEGKDEFWQGEDND